MPADEFEKFLPSRRISLPQAVAKEVGAKEIFLPDSAITYDGRKFIIARVKGQNIPIYLSSGRSRGTDKGAARLAFMNYELEGFPQTGSLEKSMRSFHSKKREIDPSKINLKNWWVIKYALETPQGKPAEKDGVIQLRQDINKKLAEVITSNVSMQAALHESSFFRLWHGNNFVVLSPASEDPRTARVWAEQISKRRVAKLSRILEHPEAQKLFSSELPSRRAIKRAAQPFQTLRARARNRLFLFRNRK